MVLAQKGIHTPRARMVTPEEYRRVKHPGTLGLALPVRVKPNYEGSSKGIGDDAVVRDVKTLAEVLPRALRSYPNGVLVEEFVPGTDVTVPFLEGRGDEGGAAAGRLRRRAGGAQPLQPLRFPPE